MALGMWPKCFGTGDSPSLFLCKIAIVLCAIFSFADASWAGEVFGGTGADSFKTDPFKTPLQNILDILTGPVALAIAMAGIVACGVALIFGGDMKEFIKTMVTITLVICVVVGAAGVMNRIFGFTETGLTTDKFTE